MIQCLDCPAEVVRQRSTRVRCSDCRRLRQNARHRVTNVARKSYAAAYWARYAEAHRTELRAASVQYRAIHREEIAATRAARHRADPTVVAAQNRAHRLAHPEVHREKARRRRAVLKGVVVERYDERAIFERDGWGCQLCGASIDPALHGRQPLAASIDHIIPLVLGGADAPHNVQAAHFGCNSRKREGTRVRGGRVLTRS